MSKTFSAENSVVYKKEFWSGDSRDGKFLGGEGFHYFKMSEGGKIMEAYEVYDDGDEVVTIVPEMINVNWFKDLGFDDFETLDDLEESEFLRIKDIITKK